MVVLLMIHNGNSWYHNDIWQLDNIDGNVHDVINTNVNYYRNLFRLMNS